MTLRHGSRVRKYGGEQVVRDLEAADAAEPADSCPTEDEIRQRAHEIYLSRGGASGIALVKPIEVTTQGESEVVRC